MIQKMYEAILNSEDFKNDPQSKQLFIDTVEYIEDRCVKKGKPFDTNLYKIYITQIKNYKLPSIEQFLRLVILLNLCGYEINPIQENSKI